MEPSIIHPLCLACSLSIMCVRSIHIIPSVRIFFLFKAESYSIILYAHFACPFICCWTFGLPPPLVKKASMTMCVQIFFNAYVYVLSPLTLCDPMDWSPPGSSVMGFPTQEYWSGLLFPSTRDLPDPGVEPECPVFPAFFTTEPPKIFFSTLLSVAGSEMPGVIWQLFLIFQKTTIVFSIAAAPFYIPTSNA